MSVKSFAVCANKHVKQELSILIYSIRRLYSEPIYVMCDEETHKYISASGFTNVHYKLTLEKSYLAVRSKDLVNITKQNNFHKPDIIYSKMDCVDWAVEKAGATMFCDADIIFTQHIHADIADGMEVMLSPHYHARENEKNNKMYGVFNAGYVWTNQTSFGDEWRDIYLNRSKFYEQQGMLHFCEKYKCGFFDMSHNVGFWRFYLEWRKGAIYCETELEWDKIKSFHLHACRDTYKNADKGLVAGYDIARNKCLPNLPKDIISYIENII